jgi:hypothetical protein
MKRLRMKWGKKTVLHIDTMAIRNGLKAAKKLSFFIDFFFSHSLYRTVTTSSMLQKLFNKFSGIFVVVVEFLSIWMNNMMMMMKKKMKRE